MRHHRKTPMSFLAAMWFGSPSVDATTHRVSAAYPTIQASIDASVDGDTVLVPGCIRS